MRLAFAFSTLLRCFALYRLPLTRKDVLSTDSGAHDGPVESRGAPALPHSGLNVILCKPTALVWMPREVGAGATSGRDLSGCRAEIIARGPDLISSSLSTAMRSLLLLTAYAASSLAVVITERSLQPRQLPTAAQTANTLAACKEIAGNISSASAVFYPPSLQCASRKSAFLTWPDLADVDHYSGTSSLPSVCTFEPATEADVSAAFKVISARRPALCVPLRHAVLMEQRHQVGRPQQQCGLERLVRHHHRHESVQFDLVRRVRSDDDLRLRSGLGRRLQRAHFSSRSR